METDRRERLFSLDVLRGLDMILLTVVGPFVAALGATVRLPAGLVRQFQHGWECFTLWDIIMPMFIFMCGAAVPFALGRRLKDGKAGWPYWRHVLGRVCLLWFLGLLAQGRLMTLDPLRISPFDNTLQSIASGYLIAAAVLLVPNRKVQVAIPIALAAVYALLLHALGDYTPAGNFAQQVENVVVPLTVPAGSRVLELADPGYTWWLTILMFGAMTLCGMEATKILTAAEDGMRRFRKLLGLGAALLAAGWATSPWIPCVKPIYTFTFTAQAMGWCCLALALLFYLTDVRKFRRGLGLFTLFGQTALLAYMTIEVFQATPLAFARTVTQGFATAFGPASVPLAEWAVVTALLVVILRFRRAAK